MTCFAGRALSSKAFTLYSPKNFQPCALFEKNLKILGLVQGSEAKGFKGLGLKGSELTVKNKIKGVFTLLR